MSNAYAESDIKGWKKAEWGMTYSQISDIYQLTNLKKNPREIQETQDAICTIIGNRHIAGIEFYHATFTFDRQTDDGRLKEVYFSKRDYKGYVYSGYNSLQIMKMQNEDFDQLILLFNEKYGKYDSREPNKAGRMVMDYVEWKRKSGTLKIIKLGGYAIDITFKASK